MALTDIYGVNYKKVFVTKPAAKIHQGEHGGRVRVIRESFALDADAANGDVVKMGRLPRGAMVLGARLFGPDMGGTGTLELGNSASVDGSLTDAADSDAFIDAADSSGQVFDVVDSAAAQRGPAIGLIRFAREVDVELKFIGATSSATGKVICMELFYIVD